MGRRTLPQQSTAGQAARDEAAARLIDRIQQLERLSAQLSGAIATASLQFAALERERQLAAGVRARDLGRGTAEQVGYARRMSPVAAARDLGTAARLRERFPLTFDLLRAGAVAWRQCQIVVRESSHLDDDLAHAVDAGLSPLLPGWNLRQTERGVRQAVYELDPHGAVERRGRAESERRVTIRPMPDTMTMVSALLPVAQGVAAHAKLAGAAAQAIADGDTRTKDQLMADLFVQSVLSHSVLDPSALDAGSSPPEPKPEPTSPAGSRPDLPAPNTTAPPPGTSPSDLPQHGAPPPPDTGSRDQNRCAPPPHTGSSAEHRGAPPPDTESRDENRDAPPPDASNLHQHGAAPPPDASPCHQHGAASRPDVGSLDQNLADPIGNHCTSTHCTPTDSAPEDPATDRPVPKECVPTERALNSPELPGVGVVLNITMSAETLLGASNGAGWLDGHGPVPADLAREIAASSAHTWVRRLLTDPTTGSVVAIERRRRAPREFTGMLRELIVARDRECRQPWCDSPIRHADHIVPHAKGGPTSADNGQGLCARGNYLKELPGWDSWREPDGTYVSTPTGHVYRTIVATTRGLPSRTEQVATARQPAGTVPRADVNFRRIPLRIVDGYRGPN
ncbi:DUF222 domain-containing protein [Nakamurella aerolata]|uniref:DUF222 domain-containing protein n=1 Tax=Nakamurella aerolata TaxID=1656892 RepID=A0A849AA52_9ACTN|nr:DUF222 domain-containing protein [Nakamurella aerolata]